LVRRSSISKSVMSGMRGAHRWLLIIASVLIGGSGHSDPAPGLAGIGVVAPRSGRHSPLGGSIAGGHHGPIRHERECHQ
jgi:hypothetical protein